MKPYRGTEGCRTPWNSGWDTHAIWESVRHKLHINKEGCMLTDMIYQFCKFSESSLPDRKIHPYKRNFLKM